MNPAAKYYPHRDARKSNNNFVGAAVRRTFEESPANAIASRTTIKDAGCKLQFGPVNPAICCSCPMRCKIAAVKVSAIATVAPPASNPVRSCSRRIPET
jgi:hypothetical protein